jgi:hypothetical protein
MHVPRNIGRKIHRLHKKLHRMGALNSEPVTLRWVDLTIPDGYLPDVETSPQPVSVPRAAVTTAFVHHVGISTTGYTRYTQVRQGDIILDFPGDVPLDDKRHLRFEIGVHHPNGIPPNVVRDTNGVPVRSDDGHFVLHSDETIGQVFIQKDGGDELAKSWDVRCNGFPVTRTVLVTPLS